MAANTLVLIATVVTGPAIYTVCHNGTSYRVQCRDSTGDEVWSRFKPTLREAMAFIAPQVCEDLDLRD